MEESVSDGNYDNNKNNNEGKEAECLDDTSPVDMEEGLSDKKGENNEKISREKRGRIHR